MTVTTSSRRLKIYSDTMKDDPISDEYIREHYGIVEPLTGDALDKEAMRIQKLRNDQWKEDNKKK